MYCILFWFLSGSSSECSHDKVLHWSLTSWRRGVNNPSRMVKDQCSKMSKSTLLKSADSEQITMCSSINFYHGDPLWHIKCHVECRGIYLHRQSSINSSISGCLYETDCTLMSIVWLKRFSPEYNSDWDASKKFAVSALHHVNWTIATDHRQSRPWLWVGINAQSHHSIYLPRYHPPRYPPL